MKYIKIEDIERVIKKNRRHKAQSMKAVIRLEDIGKYTARNRILPDQAWVAEITGHDPKYKYKRVFHEPSATDIQESNSVGSRGIYKYYWVEPKTLYEVSLPISWKNTDRFFCIVVDGKIKRLNEGEANTWLASNCSE